PWPWLGVQPRQPAGETTAPQVPDDARVFGGSDDGEARSSTFVGPDEPAGPEHRRSGTADGVPVGGGPVRG
ncbi:MAG TPA: hypothetical protein VGD43_01175, partial [Micromonospora sp.]